MKIALKDLPNATALYTMHGEVPFSESPEVMEPKFLLWAEEAAGNLSNVKDLEAALNTLALAKRAIKEVQTWVEEHPLKVPTRGRLFTFQRTFKDYGADLRNALREDGALIYREDVAIGAWLIERSKTSWPGDTGGFTWLAWELEAAAHRHPAWSSILTKLAKMTAELREDRQYKGYVPETPCPKCMGWGHPIEHPGEGPCHES